MSNILHNINTVVFSTILIAFSLGFSQWENAHIDTITNTQIEKETHIQSLGLDTLDYVHLVWSQVRTGNGWRIFYATSAPSGSWLPPEEVGDSTQEAYVPALAISPLTNEPYITFTQGGIFTNSSEIYIAYKAGGVWARKRLTNNSLTDCSSAIAVDDTLGLVHLAWVTGDLYTADYSIAYALIDTDSADIQVLTGSNLGSYGAGAAPYIAVSSRGAAHIVYRGGDYPDYHIHHAWNDSLGATDWHYEVMISGNPVDVMNALVVEKNGDLHLAVSGNDGFMNPFRTYYFYQPTGQNWQPCELISTLIYSTGNPSIDIDTFGNPRVVWDTGEGYLFYSYKDENGDWQTSTTPVIADDYRHPSFKIDRNRFGHVVCRSGLYTGIYDIYHIQSSDTLTSIKELPRVSDRSDDFYLSQNYPNPAHNFTTINYYLRYPAVVDLSVYNTLGEKIAVLVSKFHPAGNYKTEWNISDVNPGVYFYRLEIGELFQTRKCLVLK